MKLFYPLLLLLFTLPLSSQTFITLDEDTNEFITDVNYTLFKNSKPVLKGVTLPDKLTTVTADFDSISFSRLDYKTRVLPKTQLDTLVYLKKSIIHLDELVITDRKEDEIALGETNRFVKRQARAFSQELLYGVLFRNEWDTDLTVKKVDLFVNKVAYKTAYKINFYTFQESLPIHGNQDLKNLELAFTTDTLILDPRTKGKVTIIITPAYTLASGTDVLVSVELIDYYNDEGQVFKPEQNKVTELRFQLSDRADYYAKLININSRELTATLRNINMMTNYDFAHHFFKKPHKSIIVAPAIVLYAVKED